MDRNYHGDCGCKISLKEYNLVIVKFFKNFCKYINIKMFAMFRKLGVFENLCRFVEVTC